MSTRIRFRRSTAAVWTSTNPILTGGELGYETDTGKFKIGDNATAWASLAYAVRAQLSEGYLNDLADVTITSPTSGQVLKWNGTAWINDTDSAGTTVNALDDIADVTITSAASGDILKWNGSAWVNDNALLAAKAPLASPTFTGTVTLPDNTVALGTKTTGDYVSSLVAGTGVTLSNNSGETATPTIAIGQAVATNSNVTFNDLTVAGNLTVSGTTTSVNTETLTVDDNIVVLNNNVTAGPTENAGLEIERGTSANVVLRWNETTDKWETTNDGSTYSVIATNGNIALGTDTSGSYVTSLVAGTGVTLSNNSGEGATPTVTVDTSVIQARVTNVTDTEIGYLDGVTSAIQTQIDTKAPLASPTFTGTPTLPTGTIATTQTTGNNTTAIATTAFVKTATDAAYIFAGEIVTDAISTLDNIDDVTITSAANGDLLKWNGTAWVNAAGYALLASPTFTGTVTLPGTTSIGSISSTELGYVNGVTSAIQTQFSAKANLASPTFTGTPTLPTGTIATTQTALDSTTKVATTAFVTTAGNLKANLASPTFTGTPTLPTGTIATTQTASNNSTAVATTAYVDTADALKANLASPTFTGTPTAPTAAGGTNTTQVATTAFVTTAVSGATISSLDDISDVTITSNSSGQFLKWNGSTWVNDAIDLGTDTTGSYVTSLVAGTGVTLTNNSGEGATPTIAIGQAVGTGSNVTFNDLTVSGNLTVSGTTTSINTEILTVDDNIVVLNNNVTASPTENAGIEIERGTSTNVSLRWNETTDKWEFTNDGSTYNNLGAGGATISTTAPASPQEGAMWFDSDTAQTFVYYDSQWIEIGASGMAAMVSDTAPSAPIAGQIWFNSLNGGTYVYYSSAWTEVGAVPINALLNTINAKGDLLAGTADNTVGRLGVGTNGYFLKADSAETTGLIWAAIPSVSILDDVGDVTITSAASGQVLQWNGSAWINATVSTDIMTDSKNAALLTMDIGA